MIDLPEPTTERGKAIAEQIAAYEARQKAAADLKTAREALGITPAAARSVQWRLDNKDYTRKVSSATAAALKILRQLHPDEFRILYQLERRKRGLEPIDVARGNRIDSTRKQEKEGSTYRTAMEAAHAANNARPDPAPRIVLDPAPLAVVERCPHNEGLRKLQYGVFCLACGHKIR